MTSDWFAVHGVSAAAAGTDLEEATHAFFGEPLELAVRSGKISRAVLNSMVAPILREMFRFDLVNHPRPPTVHAVASTAAHRAISTRIAEAGTVLLKNAHGLLPLASSERIVIIGPAASAQVTSGGGGSAAVIP